MKYRIEKDMINSGNMVFPKNWSISIFFFFLGAKAPLGLANVTTHMLTPKSFNMQYLAYFFSLLLDIIYKVSGG